MMKISEQIRREENERIKSIRAEEKAELVKQKNLEREELAA
jgi:hypothetical protein